ncbi:MAG: signal peptidase II [Deltaproteobacteria bacterium]|nr:signal peptidase II [Deltaproteobacteria bacterium]
MSDVSKPAESPATDEDQLSTEAKSDGDEAEQSSPPPSESSDESELEGKASDEVEGGEEVVEKPKAKEPPPAPPTTKQWMMFAVVAALTAGADLWSKAWAVKRLSIPSPRVVPLCTPPAGMQHYMLQRIPQNELVVNRSYFELRYMENCGGAWGLLHGAQEKFRRPFFFLVTVLAIGFIVHLYRTLEKDQRAMRIALPLVLGGAVGNLVDRLRLGYVVDFILMHWKDKYYWPTYNIADVAITIGIALMILEFIFGGRSASPAKAKAKKA